ncbi:16S rRNA (cytidine(1402)-2'-O)-methyltransferase [Aquibaculum arenosum]|uniref:Ribosomal RNA small subunit methyltransferase I n=1 Tax=Aquibaculum arenosum TaxID=3032591 RepID=A0ABT5YJ02_9PROT|nr:16S rRNA (cytidine(1402)-2'-O)-methyltransferase [Fodinicurvata sp. CAU 1616]MDF2094883.1 16S rRNA (cytidine(1402)-2'-O)-methyltransferase [Fodinicurvata sp. CAU 1616]
MVATPIGNLADIGLRALDVLRRADLVACEDTRVTSRLLHAHGIERSLLAYHDHNAERVRPRLIEALRDGKTVALVSDAGTPLVSDPGYKLVQALLDEGLAVTAVPGASAVLMALSLSGLPSDRFFFGGFLPAKTAARRKTLGEVSAVPGTLIFFESPRRLAEALVDAEAVLGGARPAAVARELTKLHEEVQRGPLCDLVAHYRDVPPPRGEIVLLIGPLPEAVQEQSAEEQLDGRLIAALKAETLRDAVDRVAAESGLPRRRVYRRALELERGDER